MIISVRLILLIRKGLVVLVRLRFLCTRNCSIGVMIPLVLGCIRRLLVIIIRGVVSRRRTEALCRNGRTKNNGPLSLTAPLRAIRFLWRKLLADKFSGTKPLVTVRTSPLATLRFGMISPIGNLVVLGARIRLIVKLS